jgi:hypothetical protein
MMRFFALGFRTATSDGGKNAESQEFFEALLRHFRVRAIDALCV